MSILTNPVFVSVLILCGLCLLRINVLLSLIISALAAALIGGMPISEAMSKLSDGFSANAETALSYVLLGAFAASIASTGLADVMSRRLARAMGGSVKVMMLILAAAACLSQNLIPVHIAFIPILIPPLLPLMNRLRADRRAAACALAFGLKAPYISVPFGFGAIFMGIIASNMTDNGMVVTVSDVARCNWIIGLAMFAGLLAAVFVSYAKPRDYGESEAERGTREDGPLTYEHWVTAAAIIAVAAAQIASGSLPLATLSGLVVMFAFGALKRDQMEAQLQRGIQIMGMVAIVMLVAGGYAAVIKETGAVDGLVRDAAELIRGSRLAAACVMMLIGLLVTMGIGSSFSTIPVIAVFFVPLCREVGFTPPAAILLMSAAAALGDAGSPASDTTLGPTSGLNADGMHDHIMDTCVPTFLHFNTAIAIAGVAGAMMM